MNQDLDKYYGCIYKLTNMKNNQKSYIGQTKWIKGVLARKYQGSGTIIAKAIEKYGWEAFEVEILKYCNDKDELNYWEPFYIKEYNTLVPYGYNIKKGGYQGGPGNTLSESVKNEISERSKNSLWVSNGISEKFIRKDKLNKFLIDNTEYRIGRSIDICNNMSIIAKTKVGDKNSRYGNKDFPAIDKDGNIFFITSEDNRFKNKELVGLNTGRKFSKETNDKKACKGEKNGMYGVKLNGELNGVYGKIRITNGVINKTIYKTEIIPDGFRKGQTVSKIICPTCGKEGGSNVMRKYHFDNCKNKYEN